MVRNAKPRKKPYKLADGEGLFLVVKPSGSKYWRLKYFFCGKEKLLALGVYPHISLADARERRAQARKQLATGSDPGEARKEAKRLAILKNANTFEAVAEEWLEQHAHDWTPRHIRARRRQLQRFVFPKVGKKPIAELRAPDLLSVLRAIEESGKLDTAHRMLQVADQVFKYAIATGRAEPNPVPDLRGSLKAAVRKHRAFLSEKELPEFLKKLEAYDGHPQTKLGLWLLLLTFVRTGELRGAQWKEIDWDKAEWRIPAERMKMDELHIVPLSRQAIATLRELEKYSGRRQYVFPNHHNPAAFMTENTMLYALYRMGYHSRATGHGFRSTASTVLNEHGFRSDVIERQLAHGQRDKVRAAYNHAQYLSERREMMQWWADFLNNLAVKE